MGDLMATESGNLNSEELADAAELFGTSTDQETVNAAVRDAAAQSRRARALAELVEIGRSGQFDELLDKRNRP